MPSLLTEANAQKLGDLVRTHREASGYSYRSLSEAVDIAQSWLVDLEHGRARAPRPTHLARVADILEIDAGAIDNLTDGLLAQNLPSVRTYFRGRERLPGAAVAEIEAAVADVRRRYQRPNPDAPAEPVAPEPSRFDENIVPPGYEERQP